MSNIPFTTIDWTTINKIVHNGELDMAFWQIFRFKQIHQQIKTANQ